MRSIIDQLDTRRRLEWAAREAGRYAALTARGLRPYDRDGRVQFFRPFVTGSALTQFESVAEEIGAERRGQRPGGAD